MKTPPQISVLMGTYNCANTVTEAVNAIIAQTVTSWELIICDDGSTDKTFTVLQHLAEQEPRIVLIKNNVNMGLAPTLNNCLAKAQGKYIARMDGDDVCAMDRFEKELAVLESNPQLALVSCAMNFYDDNGIYGVVQYPAHPQKADFITSSPFCHAGCMMRRDVLCQLGGYSESPDVLRIEDFDLWFRLYKAGYEGYNLPDVLYSMRDDRQAYKRRKFKYRMNSAKINIQVYREFQPGIQYLPYIIAPVIKGLLPEKLYLYLHKKRLNK